MERNCNYRKLRKILCVIILIFGFFACGEKSKTEENAASTPGVDWLLGHWTRTNDEEGSQTYEVWHNSLEGIYEGKGWTIQNGDTVFQEDLRIIQSDSIWNLEVRGVNEQPTYFRITEFSEDSFTAENEQNEFPKKIKYSIKNNKLEAVISDDENEMKFLFEKSSEE